MILVDDGRLLIATMVDQHFDVIPPADFRSSKHFWRARSCLSIRWDKLSGVICNILLDGIHVSQDVRVIRVFLSKLIQDVSDSKSGHFPIEFTDLIPDFAFPAGGLPEYRRELFFELLE